MDDKPIIADHLHGLWRRDGKLTADTVLNDARDADSPIHRLFEWDDTVAAHEYRLEQARGLIRRVNVTITETTVKAFVHVRSADTYAPIEDVLRNADWRDEVIEQFHRDAERFMNKWRNHRIAGEAFERWLRSQQP